MLERDALLQRYWETPTKEIFRNFFAYLFGFGEVKVQDTIPFLKTLSLLPLNKILPATAAFLMGVDVKSPLDTFLRIVEDSDPLPVRIVSSNQNFN